MKRPELLAPAGNMEKLRIAVRYGADAVYLGGRAFGLRAMADNFTLPELAEAVSFAHGHNVRVYLTVNTFPQNHELADLARFLEEVASIPVDAYIISDAGVIDLVREISPERPLHLSTQANTVNWRSARFWQKQGFERIILGREMTLSAIHETIAQVPLDFEVFVHGALCIAYSGRCLISNLLTGRSANRGECTHPCRWRYALVEETRPGEYFPVGEDERGTFIFNSRDLCLLEHLPELVKSGVAALKIEGRMKGINYLASVVRVYRAALDRYLADPDTYCCQPEWLLELAMVSHRGYTTGFLFGQPEAVGQEYGSRYRRSHDLVGVVEDVGMDGTITVQVRNRLTVGEELQLLGPDMRSGRFRLENMFAAETGESLAVAHPNQRIRLIVQCPAVPLDLLRRERTVSDRDQSRSDEPCPQTFLAN